MLYHHFSLTQFVDNIGRRTWDVEKYREQAEQRTGEGEKKGQGAQQQQRRGLVIRGALQARNYKLDLTSNLGKTVVVSANASLSQRAGFYCDVCDVLLTDSSAYLTHINGKKHQRNLNMSMKIERVSVERVRQRLAYLKEQRGITSGTGGAGALHTRTRETVEERMLRQQKEDEEAKRRKRLKRKGYSEDKAEDGEEEATPSPSKAADGDGVGYVEGLDGYTEEDLVFDDSDDDSRTKESSQSGEVPVSGGRTFVIREAGSEEEEDEEEDDRVGREERLRRLAGNRDEGEREEEAQEEDDDDDDADFVPVAFTKAQLEEELEKARLRAEHLQRRE